MTRQDFQQIALIRLEEAKVLLDNGKYDGAYYLCGYSIECAFKACIADMTKEDEFPPKRNVIDKIYKHDLLLLLQSAGLEKDLDDAIKLDPMLGTRWNTVKDWKEESRYKTNSQKSAEDIYGAVMDPDHGVLTWLKLRW